MPIFWAYKNEVAHKQITDQLFVLTLSYPGYEITWRFTDKQF